MGELAVSLVVLAILVAGLCLCAGGNSPTAASKAAQAAAKAANLAVIAGDNNSGPQNVAPWYSTCAGLFISLAVGAGGFAMWKTGALDNFLSKDANTLHIAEKQTHQPAESATRHAAPG